MTSVRRLFSYARFKWIRNFATGWLLLIYFHQALVLHKPGILRTKGKTFLMNRWLLVLLMAVAFAPGFVSAQDTAYKALRTVGAQRGERALNEVVAIVGESGRPQPVAWRVTLDDPGAV